MMNRTRSPGPDNQDPDETARLQGALAALWSLALGRFRDYMHWTSDLTAPKADQGGSHDLDR